MPNRELRERSLEDLLTAMNDRIRRLEHRTAAVVGSGSAAWVVEVDTAGRLTARHAASGAVTVLAAP